MPQYTTRFLLLLTAAAAMVFFIISLGFRGHTWAAGLTGAIFALTITISLHAMLFGIVWTFSSMWRGSASESRSPTPFASVQPRADKAPQTAEPSSDSPTASIE